MTVLVPAITETDLKKINLCIQQLAAGRSNAVAAITLQPGSNTTVVDVTNNPNAPMIIAATSVPLLMAITASGAAEVASGNLYVSIVANGSFTITHTNSGVTDRSFFYAIQG